MPISFVHVVIGEVVPKNLAIEKADRLALLVAPALLVFLRISAPFVFVIERAAAALSRAPSACAAATAAEAIRPKNSNSSSNPAAAKGTWKAFEEDAIQKLLELQEINAREIMTPRIDIVSVSVDATLDELLRITLEHKYSRLPVYEGKPEHIIGIRALQGPGARLAGAQDRRRPPPARPPFSCCAAYPARVAGGARDQTAAINWWTNFAATTRIWRWWWTSSAPSPAW